MVTYCRGRDGCHNNQNRENHLQYYRLPKVIENQGDVCEKNVRGAKASVARCSSPGLHWKTLDNIQVCSVHFIPAVFEMDILAVPADRHKGWYLSLMAPNTKGPAFAWLDPSRLYCNSQALADCAKDLVSPFHNDTIDIVAGIDAMGFILGSSIATMLGKGLLAIRKAGHLCVETQSQNYSDYTGTEKTMEVRLDVLKPGLRVLLVDQWIETGGTMKAAIQLVERQGATVVGVAALAIENTEGGKWIKENYKSSHCIPESLQSQIDQKYLDSFKAFKVI